MMKKTKNLDIFIYLFLLLHKQLYIEYEMKHVNN